MSAEGRRCAKCGRASIPEQRSSRKQLFRVRFRWAANRWLCGSCWFSWPIPVGSPLWSTPDAFCDPDICHHPVNRSVKVA